MASAPYDLETAGQCVDFLRTVLREDDKGAQQALDFIENEIERLRDALVFAAAGFGVLATAKGDSPLFGVAVKDLSQMNYQRALKAAREGVTCKPSES